MGNSEFEPADVSPNRNFFLLTALIAAVALGIRWTIATGDSLWLDERHTAWTVADGLTQVAGRAADGNQNPLFFWLTWVSVRLFGQSELSLRLVSILAGTGLVGVAGWLTWRGSKSLLGVLVTCLIIALDWRFVFYGTEARPYALMQLLGLLHAGLFVHLVGWLPSPEKNRLKGRLTQPTKWSALTLLSIALFYCHLMSIWLFVAEAITLWVVGKFLFRDDSQKDHVHLFFKPLLLSFAAAITGCLPGILSLAQVLGRKSNWADLSSPARVLAETQEPLLFWLALPLGLLLVGGLTKKFLGSTETSEQENSQRNRLSLFVFTWAITPIVAVAGVHYLQIAPLALFRYTVIGTPAFAIFAGMMVGRTPGIALKTVAVGIIAWSSYTNDEISRQLVDRQTLPVLRHEDWASLTQTVLTTTTDRQLYPRPVLLFANVIEDAEAATDLDPRFQEYLRFPAYNIHRSGSLAGRQVFPCPTHKSPRLSDELIQNIIRSRGGWLLIRGTDSTVNSILQEVEQALSDRLPSEPSRKLQIQERNDDGDVVHLFSVDLL